MTTPKPRRRRKLDLIDHGGIATVAGVNHSAVSNWSTRYDDWPNTAADGLSTPIYWREDITAFLERHPSLAKPSQIAGNKAGAAKRHAKP